MFGAPKSPERMAAQPNQEALHMRTHRKERPIENDGGQHENIEQIVAKQPGYQPPLHSKNEADVSQRTA